MKKLICIFIFAFCTKLITAQKGKSKNSDASKADIENLTYAQGMKYGDPGVTINSLYILIVKHPENIGYKDSLARIYFQLGSYNQCLRVCDDIYKSRPDDTTTLRMMAMSHQSLGHFTEAITTYEKVILLTSNIYDIYQKAALEYRIKRLQESKISIEMVIGRAGENDKITLYIDQDNKQEVPLRAAAFNLYGMIARDFNDTASARFLFQKALELSPEFYFANANLKALDEASMDKKDPMMDNKKRK